MVLHYLTNGTARLRIFLDGQQIYLPLVMVLKALCDVTDHYIFNELIKTKEDDTFYKGCITNMLRLVQNENLFTSKQVKVYIGERFRERSKLPSWYTDEEITDYLLK